MDFIKLVVVVILIVVVLGAIAVVVGSDVGSGGPTWFERLGERQQTSAGSEVPGSPLEVVGELIWIPFSSLTAYEGSAPGVSLIAGIALAAIGMLIAIVTIRWVIKVLSA